MSTPPSKTLSQEMVAACRQRLDRLRARFRDEQIDGLLISNDIDIRYLTGFVGHDSLLLVTTNGGYIISDPRYDEFLDPWRGTSLAEIVMGARHRLEESVRQVCTSNTVKRVGVQGDYVTIARRRKLAEQLGDEAVIDTFGLVAALRMKKDELEIAAIEKAIDIQQNALQAAMTKLRVGMTEMQFCAALEYEMKVRGSEVPSFETMVSSGPNSSVIHYLTGSTPIRPGVLLIDWGATVDGYRSDMTRTFAVNTLPQKVREIYSIVLEAQLAAIEACVPGRTCAEVDAVARGIITKAGYGERFGHGLGHGLGMNTHEPPFFNNLQSDIQLEPGMVMTVEPGIYLPGVGGVRIEDDVLITQGKPRVLSSLPKDLDSVLIEPAGNVVEGVSA